MIELLEIFHKKCNLYSCELDGGMDLKSVKECELKSRPRMFKTSGPNVLNIQAGCFKHSTLIF